MARTTIDVWNPGFPEGSPVFDSIQQVSLPFQQFNAWPTLEQFSVEFKKKNIQSHNGIQILSCEQGAVPEKFDDQYESRIYLKGELQTRLESWHDFFNAMCWLQFPKSKASLNALHFENSKNRQVGTNRNPLENALTLFDECGAIIVSDDDALLNLIINHKWKELFWKNREAFGCNIQCYVFGHAMHEKSLSPYIGMTTHSLLLKQSTDFFDQDYFQQIDKIDEIISAMWNNKEILNTKFLQPFPLLGVPGWWEGKQDEAFYLNKEYFRLKRRK